MYRMKYRLVTTIAVLTSWALFAAPLEALGEEIVAVPKLRTRSKKTAGKFAKAFRAELREGGYKVLGPGSMKKAGRRAGAKPRSLEAAREAEASLLVLGRLKGKKRKTVSVSLIDVSDGRKLETITKKFRGAKRARALGTSIARELLPLIEAHFEKLKKPSPSRAIAVDRSSSGPRTSVVAPKDESGDDDEFPDTPPVPRADATGDSASKASVPKDEWEENQPKPKRKIAAADEEESASSAETQSASEKLGLAVDLEVGGVNHRYTVTVGDVATGLAYGLNFVPSLGGRVTWTSPWAGLGLAAYGAYQPFQFDVAAVDPPLNPVTPKGSFLQLGGELSLALELSSSLNLVPVIGAEQKSMSVEEQFTEGGTSSSVVLSWSGLTAYAGLRTVFSLMDNYLDLELDTRYLQFLSYDETPTTTGEQGGGMGFHAGLNIRYWLNHWMGVYLATNYTYAKVGFTGEGDRLLFDADRLTLAVDRLSDATAYHSWAAAQAGVRLNF